MKDKLQWASVALLVVVLGVAAIKLFNLPLGFRTNEHPLIITNGRILSSVPRALLITQETTTQTYALKTDKDSVNFGLFKVDIPGVVAGQSLQVVGNVITTAGVDLQKLTANDIQVTNSGNHSTVTLHLPYPKVYYTEVTDLKQDTTRGIATKLLGVGHTDLESQATQVLKDQGRAQAISAGILTLAQQHASEDMTRLLQTLYSVASPNVSVTITILYQEGPGATPTPAH